MGDDASRLLMALLSNKVSYMRTFSEHEKQDAVLTRLSFAEQLTSQLLPRA